MDKIIAKFTIDDNYVNVSLPKTIMEHRTGLEKDEFVVSVFEGVILLKPVGLSIEDLFSERNSSELLSEIPVPVKEII